ncbi:MAG: sugar-binding protein [Candidatus Brocadiia bacterium]
MRPPALLACLLLASPSPGAMVTRRWGTPPRAAPVKVHRTEPPTGYVPAAEKAPTIDGALDDACWEEAYALRLERTLDGADRASQPTEVRLCRDGRRLYVGIRCSEPFLGKLKGSRRGHDGEFWSDDSVEVFLGPAASDPYFHLAVTAFGGTYDARGKDSSWESGLEAATGRGKGRWTAELAVPLAKLAGAEGPPLRWRANFTRNRYPAGRWEEFAWSPTYSGDSHVPGRFGTLLFQEPPAEERRGQQATEAAPAVQVLPVPGGEGVVRFDLSRLAGARIYRADLRVFRTAQITGVHKEARVDIEIYPQLAEGEPQARGEPLSLRPPWYDRFDATEAVRAWAAGKPNGGFFVKACPLWRAEATCLDVAYEGEPDQVPPHATEVEAFHRSGQTFITWREIEDRVGAGTVRWGALEALLDGLDREREVRYCIYRSDRPITPESLPRAEPLARVQPLSGWNVNGRNIDRPIDEVLATREVLPCHHWSPFRNAEVDGEYGRDCVIDRLAVRDGGPLLPRGTGLYVHTATEKAVAHYAVVTCVDGVENTREVTSVGPIEEAPAEPRPVLQGELPKMPYFSYAQRRYHFVRWVGPPYANVPSQYYNWSAGVPDDVGRGLPLELSLHRDGHSYWRTQYRIERDSIVLCPHDFPLKTWWCGYHEACGTLRSFAQGRIRPYTERRLLSFVRWACRRWPVDRDRILVTGCRGGASGSGALHLGIARPDVFALVIAGHPEVDYAATARRTDRHGQPMALSMQAVWGKPDWGIPAADGASFWARHDLVARVRALPPGAPLPFVAMTSSHGDARCRAVYAAMLQGHRGIIGEFSWGGTRYVPVSNTGTYPNVVRLDIRRDKAYLAFVSPEGLQRVREGKMGGLNLSFRWRDLAEEPDRFQATVFRTSGGEGAADICVRRLQAFRVVEGVSYAWSCGDAKGQARAGEDGLLVLRGVPIGESPASLVVVPVEGGP